MADLPYPTNELDAAVLGAIVSEPGEWLAEALADDLGATAQRVKLAIERLVAGGYVQPPDGPGPYRPTNDGAAVVHRHLSPPPIGQPGSPLAPSALRVLRSVALGLTSPTSIGKDADVRSPNVPLDHLRKLGLVVRAGRGRWLATEAGRARVGVVRSEEPTKQVAGPVAAAAETGEPGARASSAPGEARQDQGDAPAGDARRDARPVAPAPLDELPASALTADNDTTVAADDTVVVDLEPRRGLSVVHREEPADDDYTGDIVEKLDELVDLTRRKAQLSILAEIEKRVEVLRTELASGARA